LLIAAVLVATAAVAGPTAVRRDALLPLTVFYDVAGNDEAKAQAALEQLAELGARPTLKRVVEQGKVITAAGVSSGIDMALTLAARVAGDDVAQTIQLGIEYDPQPPFHAGSPQTAPPHIVERLRERLRERLAGAETR